MRLSSTADGPGNATIDLYEAPVPGVSDGQAEVAFERIRACLFAYDIFPSWFMQGLVCPAGPIANGALIVQRARFGPVAMEMAVRVVAVWDREEGGTREAGFRYVTIDGHAERGVASFAVRRDAAGQVTVVLGARSRPGNRLTVLGRPIARLVQRSMTRAAVRRLSAAGNRAVHSGTS